MLSSLLLALSMASAASIALHPVNPHYFLFRGKPTVLLTSGEHYGAVLNQDFNYVTYLNELHKDRLNYTRIFTGAYCEDSRSFNIRENTLAPGPGRLICPWARSDVPGYSNGGSKFDLSRWDESYFQRLTAFCREAGRQGVVVEVSLFCPFYEESMWSLSPMNQINNVNGVGSCPRLEVYTLKHPEVTRVQDEMVRKLCQVLAGADNVLFEICNEPYFGGVTLEWQRHISGVIAAEERRLGTLHLIAQNIANGSAHVADPDPQVSILNFHYASPPDAIAENYSLGRAVGFDETGFKGSDDRVYRAQAWDFLMAGGGLFNNLDYSFTVATPDGSAKVSPPTPGGGGANLRRQLSILQKFVSRLNFVSMRPANELIVSPLPTGATVRLLSEPGRSLALYVHGDGVSTLALQAPAGSYDGEWVHPASGEVLRLPRKAHAGGRLELALPPYHEDLALRLVRRR